MLANLILLFEFHGFSWNFGEQPMECGLPEKSKESGTYGHRLSSHIQCIPTLTFGLVVKTLLAAHTISVSRHGLHSPNCVFLLVENWSTLHIHKNAFGELKDNFP